MKIEEAILYVLAERNGGLRTEQIAEIINKRRLHVRKDGQPVTSAQVYAVVMHIALMAFGLSFTELASVESGRCIRQ